MNDTSKKWAIYTFEALALAGGATATDTVNIEVSSLFVLVKLTQFSDIAAAAQTDATRVLPLVTISIYDTGSSAELFDAPVPIPSIFGDGNIPYILPVALPVAGGSTLRASFLNLTAATTYNVRLALSGFKVFDYRKGT